MAMEKFHYTTRDGVKITLPFLEDTLSARFVRDHQDEINDKGVFVLLDAVAAKSKELAKQVDKVLDLPLREFNTVSTAWQEGRDLSMGESED